MTAHDIRTPAEAAVLREVRAADGETVLFGQNRHIKRSGEVFDIELHARVVDMNGRLAYLTVMEDVTERRLAEQRMADASAAAELATETIRVSEERYRALVRHSPEGFIIHEYGVVLFANSAAARIGGASEPPSRRAPRTSTTSRRWASGPP